jgi:S-disulfanyl-L-cysteine oxidoreductase SoxD
MLALGAVACSDGAPKTTLDGLYTPEQAQRGEALYSQHCARCHSRQEFAGRLFDTVWSGQPLYALYHRIATTMPMDQPGSLGSNQVAALTAHILALNGMPSGEREIGADRDWLSSIRIEVPD